jgi:membrane protease YdiL (CAAX protease family)
VQLSLQQVPGFNSSQPQDLGISTHLVGGDLLLAYIVLVILTPFFEEFIFLSVSGNFSGSVEIFLCPLNRFRN